MAFGNAAAGHDDDDNTGISRARVFGRAPRHMCLFYYTQHMRARALIRTRSPRERERDTHTCANVLALADRRQKCCANIDSARMRANVSCCSTVWHTAGRPERVVFIRKRRMQQQNAHKHTHKAQHTRAPSEISALLHTRQMS